MVMKEVGVGEEEPTKNYMKLHCVREKSNPINNVR